MGPAGLLTWVVVTGSAIAAGPVPRSSSGPSVSGNGLYSVELVEEGQDPSGQPRCRLSVVREEQPVWRLDRCVGGVHDLYFVSNDGERVWVLFPLGELPPAGRRGRGPAWHRAVVAALYGRAGESVRRERLSGLVSLNGRQKVRLLARHFQWLQGSGQIPGRAPRILPEGVVELETVEPKTVRLTFE